MTATYRHLHTHLRQKFGATPAPYLAFREAVAAFLQDTPRSPRVLAAVRGMSQLDLIAMSAEGPMTVLTREAV